jgi:hypothetical protein
MAFYYDKPRETRRVIFDDSLELARPIHEVRGWRPKTSKCDFSPKVVVAKFTTAQSEESPAKSWLSGSFYAAS